MFGKNALSMGVSIVMETTVPLMNSVVDFHSKSKLNGDPLIFIGVIKDKMLTIKSVKFRKNIEQNIENILAIFRISGQNDLNKLMRSPNLFSTSDELYCVDPRSGKLPLEKAFNTPLNTIVFFMDDKDWFVLSGFEDAQAKKPVPIKEFYLQFYEKFYPTAVVERVKNSSEFLRVYSTSEDEESEIFHLEPMLLRTIADLDRSIDVVVEF